MLFRSWDCSRARKDSFTDRPFAQGRHCLACKRGSDGTPFRLPARPHCARNSANWCGIGRTTDETSDQLGDTIMAAINCAAALLAGRTPALVWSMYADCADHGECKTGRRTTALVFSTVQLSHKFGLAVGAGLAGSIPARVGFLANEAQSAT